MCTRARTEHWAPSLEDTQVRGRWFRRCPEFDKPPPPAQLCLLPFPSSSLTSLTGTLEGRCAPRWSGGAAGLGPGCREPKHSPQLSQVLRDRWPDSAGSPGCHPALVSGSGPSSPAGTIRFVTLSNPMNPLTWTASQGHMGQRGEGCVCARGCHLLGDLQACCTHSHSLAPTPTPTTSLTLPGLALGSSGGAGAGGALTAASHLMSGLEHREGLAGQEGIFLW